MKKEFARQLFSIIFLFIFFAKMVISIAPLVASHLDSKFMNAVIMQLEIENHPTKSTDQLAKDSLSKGECLNGFNKYNLDRPHIGISVNRYILMREHLIQAFYPSVPTPPPNNC
jgi:hypothetical protein